MDLTLMSDRVADKMAFRTLTLDRTAFIEYRIKTNLIKMEGLKMGLQPKCRH